MGNIQKDMQVLKFIKEKEDVNVLRYLFNFYSHNNNYIQALHYLKAVEKRLNELVEVDQVFFMMEKFNFYVKHEKLKECLQTLNELKLYKAFTQSEDYLYIKLLLLNLINDAPVYFSSDHFNKRCERDFQMQFIKACDEKKWEIAHVFWKELTAMNPKKY